VPPRLRHRITGRHTTAIHQRRFSGKWRSPRCESREKWERKGWGIIGFIKAVGNGSCERKPNNRHCGTNYLNRNRCYQLCSQVSRKQNYKQDFRASCHHRAEWSQWHHSADDDADVWHLLQPVEAHVARVAPTASTLTRLTGGAMWRHRASAYTTISSSVAQTSSIWLSVIWLKNGNASTRSAIASVLHKSARPDAAAVVL
jgi:hypothetical protein